MKKILILISLLIFILMFAGCNNAVQPDEPIPYVPYTPEEVIPEIEEYVHQPEPSYVTPEMLVGTWVLDSQETEHELFERIVIFDSGVKLLFDSDGVASALFWSVYDSVLSSSLSLLEDSVDTQIMINADGALIFTYYDGLTGTFIRLGDEFPAGEIIPQLVGQWELAFHSGYGELPDFIEFFSNGFGLSHYFATGLEREFQWSVVDNSLLFRNFDGEYTVSIIQDLLFHPAFNRCALSVYLCDELFALYLIPDEALMRELPSLRGGNLYDIVSPINLNRFQYNNRYTFEQFFLPSVIFGMYDEVVDMLQTGDLRGMSELIHDAWTAQRFMFFTFEDLAENVPHFLAFATAFNEAVEAADEADRDDLIFYLVTTELGLGDEHIVGVTFEELDEYTNAFIIEMKDVQAGWLSTFLGIAYNERSGLFMFTLERGHTPAGADVFHVFCILHIAARGSFFPIENTREAFARYIGYAMDGSLGTPGHVTHRELWDLRDIFG